MSDTKGDAHAPVSMDVLGAPSPKAVDSALRAERAKQQNFVAGTAILKEMHMSVQEWASSFKEWKALEQL